MEVKRKKRREGGNYKDFERQVERETVIRNFTQFSFRLVSMHLRVNLSSLRHDRIYNEGKKDELRDIRNNWDGRKGSKYLFYFAHDLSADSNHLNHLLNNQLWALGGV